MSEWISVKDGLPKGGTVLATDGRVVITAKLRKSPLKRTGWGYPMGSTSRF